MTDIYVIRHAEAEGNLYRRIQGRYNSRLTDLGEKQVAALAERFSDVHVDAVYASGLRRANMTAAGVADPKGLEVRIDERLIEVDMGEWEDMPWGQLQKDTPEQLHYFNNEPEKWCVKGGEPMQVIVDRMMAALRDIIAENEGKTVVIVSHGLAIRCLFMGVQGIPVSESKQIPYSENAGVSLIRADENGYNVLYYGDFQHIPEELSTERGKKRIAGKNGGVHPQLYYERIDMHNEEDASFYMDCRVDAWRVIHGSIYGFSRGYEDLAREHGDQHPRALVRAMWEDRPVGVMEMDLEALKSANTARIAFLYLLEEFRGRGLAIQLIGHAVSVARSLGFDRLELHVAEENLRARKFYTRYGFSICGVTQGAVGRLFVMKKDIKV